MSKSKSNGETTPKEYREKSNVNQKPNKDFTNLPEILHKANNDNNSSILLGHALLGVEHA